MPMRKLVRCYALRFKPTYSETYSQVMKNKFKASMKKDNLTMLKTILLKRSIQAIHDNLNMLQYRDFQNRMEYVDSSTNTRVRLSDKDYKY